MLSGFAYATFHALVSARAYDAGIALARVTPAYTSVIGACKFADRYGLSRHQAAACAIGRRGMRLAERPNRRMGDHVAFPLPARNRGTHVWSFWRQVARRAAAQQARGRPGPRARSSPVPTPGRLRGPARRAIRSAAAGGTPARKSSAALFGQRLWACPNCPQNQERFSDSTFLSQYSHYSLLATVEAIFNLGTLGRNDTSATPMSDLFRGGIP